MLEFVNAAKSNIPSYERSAPHETVEMHDELTLESDRKEIGSVSSHIFDNKSPDNKYILSSHKKGLSYNPIEVQKYCSPARPCI